MVYKNTIQTMQRVLQGQGEGIVDFCEEYEIDYKLYPTATED